mmetsp:Transcript_28357/g.80050  ORF Transcript_28357/g.80050 Transcript_28357/m.80050 type:complete len:324 (+) Transcript_28357:206-1177(+)
MTGWLQVKGVCFTPSPLCNDPIHELVCLLRAGKATACTRLPIENYVDGTAMPSAGIQRLLLRDDDDELEFHLVSIASQKRVSALKIAPHKDAPASWWSTVDRLLALLSVGSQLDPPCEYNGHAEQQQPREALQLDAAASASAGPPKGSATVSLAEVRQQWVQACEVDINAPDGGGSVGKFSVLLGFMPVVCEGVLQLRAPWPWGGWKDCFGELWANGELRLYVDKRQGPRRLSLRIGSPASGTTKPGAQPFREDTCDIKVVAPDAGGKLIRASLRLPSSTAAREWLQLLQEAHRRSKDPPKELDEEGVRCFMAENGIPAVLEG